MPAKFQLTCLNSMADGGRWPVFVLEENVPVCERRSGLLSQRDSKTEINQNRRSFCGTVALAGAQLGVSGSANVQANISKSAGATASKPRANA
jgi:hypothetical protein